MASGPNLPTLPPKTYPRPPPETSCEATFIWRVKRMKLMPQLWLYQRLDTIKQLWAEKDYIRLWQELRES